MTARRCVSAVALACVWASAPVHAADPRQRLPAASVAALPIVRVGPGTSGAAGIETRLLHGDPALPGPYTIAIRVPPGTHIAAHTHRDDRSAVVVSGLWHFGYGTAADDARTKALPAGSYYTEPAGDAHFAWTGPAGATVYISGIGPSDTRFTAH